MDAAHGDVLADRYGWQAGRNDVLLHRYDEPARRSGRCLHRDGWHPPAAEFMPAQWALKGNKAIGIQSTTIGYSVEVVGVHIDMACFDVDTTSLSIDMVYVDVGTAFFKVATNCMQTETERKPAETFSSGSKRLRRNPYGSMSIQISVLRYPPANHGMRRAVAPFSLREKGWG
jgi:hypothetical protein